MFCVSRLGIFLIIRVVKYGCVPLELKDRVCLALYWWFISFNDLVPDTIGDNSEKGTSYSAVELCLKSVTLGGLSPELNRLYSLRFELGSDMLWFRCVGVTLRFEPILSRLTYPLNSFGPKCLYCIEFSLNLFWLTGVYISSENSLISILPGETFKFWILSLLIYIGM